MFVTGDRSPISARLMFVSSNRTWPLGAQKAADLSLDHLLVSTNGPVSPSGMRRTLDGTRATISRISDSASTRLTLPLKWT